MTYNQKIWLGVLLLCALFWGGGDKRRLFAV